MASLVSVDRINAALEVAVAQSPPSTGSLCVCQATEDEWNAFVDSDGHIVRPHFLEWFADTGEIHIIEFADAPHENYVVALTQNAPFAQRYVRRWLQGHGPAKNSQGRRWCADASWGPRRTTPGSVLPPGIPLFDDFRTIRVEVGVSQRWGMAQGQLDHKAISIWAAMPGVEYVLCVKFDPNYANAEYKLYDVRVNPLVPLAPIPIAAPRTMIHMDGRRVLGIPQGMALPTIFPTVLSVDLYSALYWARLE
ncbi:hypothetical protein DVH05_013728 [Phytophthora capsici]|nr:hypothetical protein DVH05_013728 [Phytophthora capsici]